MAETATAFKKIGVVIGCHDVVFAKLTEDAAQATTYDETNIQSAPGVIEIAMTAQVSEEALGADDVALYEIFNSLDGFDVSMTVASLGADGRAFLLGNKADSKGVLIEKGDDLPPYVAMGFKTARSDKSDDYIWLYKGKFAQGDATYRTKEKGKVNWQTPVLTGKFVPRISDKAIRAIVNNKDTLASTILPTFFTSVYKETAATGT